MDYSEMNLADLKVLARQKGMKSFTALRKADLISLMEEFDREHGTADNAHEKRTVGRTTTYISRSRRGVAPRTEAATATTGEEPVRTKRKYTRHKLTPKEEAKLEERRALAAETYEELSTGRTEESERRVGRPVQSELIDGYDEEVRRSEYTDASSEYDSEYDEDEEEMTAERHQEEVETVAPKRPGRPRKPRSIEDLTQAEISAMSQNIQTPDGEINKADAKLLDSGDTKEGIFEKMPEGFGFIRCDNYLPGENDVYVSPQQIKKFGLRNGDYINGNTRLKSRNEKFSALLYINSVNGFPLKTLQTRPQFEKLTPVFPNRRIRLETDPNVYATRMVDLISPIGKGQRGMIVSQPKAGKTTLLKQIALAVQKNNPEMHIIILLIDERPEEVTDMKDSIKGDNVEIIYSTFDETPENHKRVSEMVLDRAKRLVEHKKDVMILLDSITRLSRAYNLTVTASGRTLSGGLDPAALTAPKKFFGAARNMREGGSLTILATALVDTGSRLDDMVFEEFKGTGNMELVLDRNLAERRIFPAIDLSKSSTRRDDLLFDTDESEANGIIKRALKARNADEQMVNIIKIVRGTRTNKEVIHYLKENPIESSSYRRPIQNTPYQNNPYQNTPYRQQAPRRNNYYSSSSSSDDYGM